VQQYFDMASLDGASDALLELASEQRPARTAAATPTSAPGQVAPRLGNTSFVRTPIATPDLSLDAYSRYAAAARGIGSMLVA
jgi:hypothetical protein